jgi:hypothetical protein
MIAYLDDNLNINRGEHLSFVELREVYFGQLRIILIFIPKMGFV